MRVVLFVTWVCASRVIGASYEWKSSQHKAMMSPYPIDDASQIVESIDTTKPWTRTEAQVDSAANGGDRRYFFDDVKSSDVEGHLRRTLSVPCTTDPDEFLNIDIKSASVATYGQTGNNMQAKGVGELRFVGTSQPKGSGHASMHRSTRIRDALLVCTHAAGTAAVMCC